MREVHRHTLGEVYTPDATIDIMLSMVPEEKWVDGATFIDPSCGIGNICCAIIKKKISLGHSVVSAISSVYGMDIQSDNVTSTMDRVIAMAMEHGMTYHNAHTIVKDRYRTADFMSSDTLI